MKRNRVTRFGAVILVVVSALVLLPTVEAASGNIDPVHRWAWGANIGWLNFNDTHGAVTVAADHLEGYVWAENVGWIRLGSAGSGSTPYFANTTKDNYGVNRNSAGNLSGYAWGTNVGWINFRPTHGGVTIDPGTGSFDGYAWGENVGWIHFQGSGAVTYHVATGRVDLKLFLPFIR